MRNRRRITTIFVVATVAWPVSAASAAVQIPCSRSIITIDETFIARAPRVCFQWMNVSPGSALFSEELVAKGDTEFLSFVVDRAGTGAAIRLQYNPVQDWLPGAYDWVGRGDTDWGDDSEFESDLGPVQFAAFRAGDGSACLGFRVFYGHSGEWARIRVTGAYCDRGRDWVGSPDVQRIFDMVNFDKGEIKLHQYILK